MEFYTKKEMNKYFKIKPKERKEEGRKKKKVSRHKKQHSQYDNTLNMSAQLRYIKYL